MNIVSHVPERSGNTRTKETVGTGDSSTTTYYLAKVPVLDSTESLTYGSAGTALTRTTDYTITNDTGKVVLTGTAVTNVGTDIIYGEYNYNGLGLTNERLQQALDRAQERFDTETNNHFATGTDTTPDWKQVTEEKHRGKGYYDNDYFTEQIPVANLNTAVGVAVGTADTQIDVTSTQGFPTAGSITIGSDKITYTGKVGTAFTGVTGIDSTHDVGDDVFGHVIETSNTSSGTTPTFQTLQQDQDYDIDLESGRIHIYKNATSYISSLDGSSPPRLVPNRVRVTYSWSESTIPADVKECVLMIASTDILHTTVRKSHAEGTNTFNPSMINVDEDQIKQTIDRYKIYRQDNV